MINVLQGDCQQILKSLPDQSVQCCVTSPPYWGLRDYGVDGQIGLEKSPKEYVEKMVNLFREVRRVLKDDGTLWLNLGDSYAGYWGDKYAHRPFGTDRTGDETTPPNKSSPDFKTCGFKPKDLIGIPWMVAFALRDDGWYLRSDIIWHKPNPMPESVTDRPTRSHEYIFLLSKQRRYYYDGDAVREPYNQDSLNRYLSPMQGTAPTCRQVNGDVGRREREKCVRDPNPLGRNKRDVWTVTTGSFDGVHFATFPPDLIKPCIMASSRLGDTILDPFGGSGTTGQVALELGRKAILIELNPDYISLINQRTDVTPAML